MKYGVLKFKLGGKNFALNVYQIGTGLLSKTSEYKDLLFVPFKDLTNGKETYGAGRYIDIKIPAGRRGNSGFQPRLQSELRLRQRQIYLPDSAEGKFFAGRDKGREKRIFGIRRLQIQNSIQRLN